MEISELVKAVMDDETLRIKVDRDKFVKILTDGLKCKKDEKDVFECLYKTVYGDVLIPEMCEELIDKMSNSYKSGAVWSLSDTNAVAKKLEYDFEMKPYTPEEFRAVMTMEYYEHSIPLKESNVSLEPTGWGRMADYALTKEPDKLVNYYFCKK